MNAHGSHSMAKTALWEVISETNNLFHNFDRIVTACLIMRYILRERLISIISATMYVLYIRISLSIHELTGIA
jgi:hypothetical protein